MGDMATDLCWGKRVLDKVVKWDAPMSMGGLQDDEHHLYVQDCQPCRMGANNPEVQEAFPRIKKILDRDKEVTLSVHLTSEGWEEAGRSGF